MESEQEPPARLLMPLAFDDGQGALGGEACGDVGAVTG